METTCAGQGEITNSPTADEPDGKLHWQLTLVCFARFVKDATIPA